MRVHLDALSSSTLMRTVSVHSTVSHVGFSKLQLARSQDGGIRGRAAAYFHNPLSPRGHPLCAEVYSTSMIQRMRLRKHQSLTNAATSASALTFPDSKHTGWAYLNWLKKEFVTMSTVLS